MAEEYPCPAAPVRPWTMSKCLLMKEYQGFLLLCQEKEPYMDIETHIFRYWPNENRRKLREQGQHGIELYNAVTGVTQMTWIKKSESESESESQYPLYMVPWNIHGAGYEIEDTIFMRWDRKEKCLCYYVNKDSPRRQMPGSSGAGESYRLN